MSRLPLLDPVLRALASEIDERARDHRLMANRRDLLITSKFDEIEKRLIELTSLVHDQNENNV